MFSNILDQLGWGSVMFNTGSGILDASTGFLGNILWVLGGNLGNWGS